MHHTTTRYIGIFLFFLCFNLGVNGAPFPEKNELNEFEHIRSRLEKNWGVTLWIGLDEVQPLQDSLGKLNHKIREHLEIVQEFVAQLNEWQFPPARDIREQALKSLSTFVVPTHPRTILSHLQLFYQFYATDLSPNQRENRLQQARNVFNQHPDDLIDLSNILFPNTGREE